MPAPSNSGDLGVPLPAAKGSRDIYIAGFTVLGIAAHLILRYGFRPSDGIARVPLLGVLLLGGTPLLIGLLRRAVRGEFGSDLLAGMSIAVSAVLGEYLAGSIVVLMLSGGTALENYATRRASAVLAALARRMPRDAHRRVGSQIVDITLDDLGIGDTLVVFPHEICPVDGAVVEGRGSMDEAYLTGEPFQISKVPGSDVLAGAVNGDSAITVTVSRLPVDSRYSRIMRVMQQAETNRPRMRRIADRLGAWYTLFGIVIAAIGWAVGRDPSRFLAVLVIATPCPLLLAIPVAIIGAVSMAASRGIIIKDPAMLERISSCTTVIFDKTGTLTYGKPALTGILCAPGIDRLRALQLAASLEQYSKHPLAGTVLAAARAEGIDLLQASEIGERPGAGLSGSIGSVRVVLTGRKAVSERGGAAAGGLPPLSAGMECILLLDDQYAACLQFRDEPRKESGAFVGHLLPHHRVSRVMLISGDREAEVRHLAAQVGITEVLFSQSPEQKLQIVRAETAKAPTLFLGDGINDAPAMQAATVGIAFGQSSDITAEAADAVVLETSLAKVDELLHIGRRMRRIALQSAVGGMALSVVGMFIAAAGFLPPVAGAIAQEVIDAAAVLNALRVSLPGSDLRDDGI